MSASGRITRRGDALLRCARCSLSFLVAGRAHAADSAASCATMRATRSPSAPRRAASCRWRRVPPPCCLPPAPAHCMVGTIAHSDEPAEAARVPVVGDAETLDFEQLLGLRPTVVVVAVDVVQRVRIDRIRALGIPVYQVHVTRLAQMPESLRRLGALAGTEAVGEPQGGRARRRTRGARRALPQPRAGARAVPDLGPAYLHDRRPARDHRRAHACAAPSTSSPTSSTAAPAVTREAAVLRNPRADPRLGAAGRGRRMAGRVAQVSGAGRGARRATGESRGRAHRSHGPVGHRGHRQSVRGHRSGARKPSQADAAD